MKTLFDLLEQTVPVNRLPQKPGTAMVVGPLGAENDASHHNNWDRIPYWVGADVVQEMPAIEYGQEHVKEYEIGQGTGLNGSKCLGAIGRGNYSKAG